MQIYPGHQIKDCFFIPLNLRRYWSFENIVFFYEADNHVQVSPDLKVNQLLKMID